MEGGYGPGGQVRRSPCDELSLFGLRRGYAVGACPAGHQPAQRSGDVIGPFELQDFYLCYTLRFGYPPHKVALLGWHAWHDVGSGRWPEVPEDLRHEYRIDGIKRWLGGYFSFGSSSRRSTSEAAFPMARRSGLAGHFRRAGETTVHLATARRPRGSPSSLRSRTPSKAASSPARRVRIDGGYAGWSPYDGLYRSAMIG